MNVRILVACRISVGLLGFALGICLCQGQNTGTPATAGEDVIMQRGPDSRVWGVVSLITNQDATVEVVTNQSYIELATGICYLSNGVYVDSVEEVDPVPGGAQAVHGRHHVQWALNANTPGGAVTVLTPDGKQLSSTVYGLAYYDIASGSNAPISWLKNCNGAIVAPNGVLYSDVFSNITADLSYTYTLAGLSQDLEIRQAPPPPHAYGLSDATSVLQLYTQFFNAQQPEMSAVTNGVVVDNQVISFGTMQMGLGQAFFFENQTAPTPAGIVAKQWLQTGGGQTAGGQTFLIEAIPYAAISNQLQQLPQASNIKPGSGSVRRTAFLQSKPSTPGSGSKEKKTMKMAKADTGGKRLRIDYVLLSGTNTLDLQGDTTYFVTNTVNVSGTLTIEGGTVVKYINNGLAEIIATNIVCLSSNYAPGVFTSMNDNSVGATITNSTGTPAQSTNFYLYFGGLGTNSLVFRNLRFSYGGECISGIINVSGTNSIDPTFRGLGGVVCDLF
jgi:hypothetical protein